MNWSPESLAFNIRRTLFLSVRNWCFLNLVTERDRTDTDNPYELLAQNLFSFKIRSNNDPNVKETARNS